MDTEAIAAQIKAYIASDLAAGRPFDEDGDLFETGILDSLKLLSLVMFIEEKFDLVLAPDELTEDTFSRISALATMVAAKTGATR